MQGMKERFTSAAWSTRNGVASSGLACLLVACSSASAFGQPAYPRELHGFWIPESADCPAAGASFDGDPMMDIAADRLVGYEQASKPMRVTELSRSPKAWKIESLLDIGPSGTYEKTDPQIFVLGERTLAVASEDSAAIFKRCERRD